MKEQDSEQQSIKDKAAKATTEVAADDSEEEGELVLIPGTTLVTGSAHDDFDWSRGRRNEVHYSKDDSKKYMESYDSTMKAMTVNEIVRARVVSITGTDAVLDLNFKSDGLLPLSDLRDMYDLKPGDTVDVYVENQEDSKGKLVLSRRKAKLLRAWEAIVDSFANGTIIRGTVISKTKGGLIVDAGGLETFLPGSQIDIKPIADYDQFVGKVMEFKVVKINETIKNAVVSHKALIESDLAEQREAIISGLEKGQVLEGTVKNITDFGAFLDLGGVDGLLYITDISWGRIQHPNEVLHLNQKINVVVLDFDENKKRISLGLKQLQPHPWEVLARTVSEGSTVKGKIVNIEDYGAFLEIQPGVEGLIHVSEVSWANQPINAKEYFKLGFEYEAKVVTIDRDDRKMSLSIKQLSSDPWFVVDQTFPIGSKHNGEVKNITQYGVFVELGQGIGGMIHISDLSWVKRYAHPAEFTKIGERINVVILEIDKDNKKISLGHKQIEESPWESFSTVFTQGSYHQGLILRRDDKGAIVQLTYGLEAFAPIKQLKKEDGTTAEQGESLTFKIIEFNRDDKRVLVSHTRYADDVRRENEAAEQKRKDAADNAVRNEEKAALKAAQDKVERSTLGELDALTQLKDKLN
jgi:small subunit ribosomal protein S1